MVAAAVVVAVAAACEAVEHRQRVRTMATAVVMVAVAVAETEVSRMMAPLTTTAALLQVWLAVHWSSMAHQRPCRLQRALATAVECQRRRELLLQTRPANSSAVTVKVVVLSRVAASLELATVVEAVVAVGVAAPVV